MAHILHININGIRNKRQTLIEYLADEKPDIVSVNETKLAEYMTVKISGYAIERKDRNGRGGGVALLIKQGLPYNLINTDYLKDEAVAVEVNIGNRKTAVISVYNPPGQTVDRDLFRHFTNTSKHCIFLGDFNSKHLFFGNKVTDRAGDMLLDSVEEADLYLVNDTGEPTRQTWFGQTNRWLQSEVLDFIFVTRPILTLIHSCEIKGDLMSDHLPMHLKLDKGKGRIERLAPVNRKSFKDTNWQHFANDVRDNLATPFCDTRTTESIDIECNKVSVAINKAMETNSKNVKVQARLWRCSRETLLLIRLKRKIRRRTQLYPDKPIYRTLYNTLKARVQKLIKEEKRQNYIAYCETLNSDRGRDFWTCFRRITGTVSKGSRCNAKPLTKRDGHPTASDAEKANVFAETLSETHTMHVGPIFCDNNRRLIEQTVRGPVNAHLFTPLVGFRPEQGDDHPMLNPVNAPEIQAIVSKAKKNSSPGADEISYGILAKCPLPLFERLADIFNMCLETGHFPRPWKQASGVMIPKPGKDHSLAINFRPISLLSCMGKVFERILSSRITAMLDTRGFFNCWQKAYRKNNEGTEHIHRLISQGKKAMEKGWCTGAIFLDVEKAFDSVWHDGLRYKLTKIGLPDKMVRILSSFLRDRSISVRQGRSHSDMVKLRAGTPQGSVLSPLLFLIYVNDLAVDPMDQIQVSQFADDLGLWTSHGNPYFIQKRLQSALNKLETWCSLWRIKLNAKKSQVIIFNRRRKEEPGLYLELFGRRLADEAEATLLGVKLDKRLSLKTHVDSLCERATKRVKLLYRLKGTGWGADSACVMKIYKMFIRPLFEYDAIDLAGCCKSRLAKLQIIQNWAIRIAFGQPRWSRISVLHELASIPTVTDRLESLRVKTEARLSRSPLYQDHTLMLLSLSRN